MLNNIEPTELHALMENQPITLVDVRNGDEVARGIIEGAIHIPLSQLPAQISQLPTGKPLVFYCHSGIRSAHAADLATGKGFKKVYNLAGGVLAWAKAGYSFVLNSPQTR